MRCFFSEVVTSHRRMIIFLKVVSVTFYGLNVNLQEDWWTVFENRDFRVYVMIWKQKSKKEKKNIYNERWVFPESVSKTKKNWLIDKITRTAIFDLDFSYYCQMLLIYYNYLSEKNQLKKPSESLKLYLRSGLDLWSESQFIKSYLLEIILVISFQ